MDAILPRLHLFEIEDQSWCPQVIRSRLQAFLSIMWTTRLPPAQAVSPATLWANILLDTLGPSATDYTFVDFCAGAGGPTPFLEQAINSRLTTTINKPVDFVLTDRSPHVAAWKLASARSAHVHFVPTPVDATRAPTNLLAKAGLPADRRVMRTFHMSFHHFDDAAAVEILRDTFRTADGIAVVELVERRLRSLVFNLFMPGPLLVLPALMFWHDPAMLFFTYVLPVLPLVTVFDGIVSCLRGRSEGEFMALVERAQQGGGEVEGWEWRCGRVRHSWPLGYMNYFIGQRKRKVN